MSRRAWVYFGFVLCVGTLLIGLAWLQFRPAPEQWAIFGVLLTLATLAQLFKVEAPSHTLYYATPIFFFAGILLLSPFLLACMIVLSLLAEWVKERLVDSNHLRNWYLQPFNMAMYTIAALCAHWSYGFLNPSADLYHTAMVFVAVTCAGIVYVVVNHVLLGLVLMLARGKSWRESAALDQENLFIELILVCVGYSVALVYTLSPWLIIPTLAPLALMYQALRIPQLKHDAHVDGKTGLLNARHFSQQSTAVLERAIRQAQPLAFVMADLDFLRTINNTYGHLAGDVVLAGIAETIRITIRDSDLAGRFGGEEFAILLPNTNAQEARAVAEQVRLAVEARRFVVTTSPTPIQVTMSLGVACFPAEATTMTELMAQADVAVYQAKSQGRNRVVCVADLPQALTPGHAPVLAPLGSDGPAATDYTPPASRPVVLSTEEPAMAMVASLPQAQIHQQRATLPTPESPMPQTQPQAHIARPFRLILVVSLVIGLGCLVTLIGWMVGAPPSVALVGLLMLLAVAAELLQVDLYGTGTISVSLAAIYAAALTTGIAGLSCVSAAAALGAAFVLARTSNRKPTAYKIVFNWATHILAGTPTVLLFGALAIPLQIQHLAILIVPVLFTILAYYVIETGLIATAIGFSIGSAPQIAWRERYQWLAQHYGLLGVMGLFLAMAYVGMGLGGLMVFWLPILAFRLAQRQYVQRTAASIHELERMNGELRTANKSIQQLNEELFSGLASFFDARDPYTGEHSATVARYAADLAEELGLDSEQIRQARQAGYLHDIGKIAIPEAILYKPGKLTAEEYEQVKTHTTIGAELLFHTHGLRHLAPFVRQHHERWDGHGYPDGVSGPAIPLIARVLNVCDAVEAMASDRPYQRGKAVAEIIAELQRGAGTQFDPTVVQMFIRIAERKGPAYISNSAQRVQRAAQARQTGVFELI